MLKVFCRLLTICPNSLILFFCSTWLSGRVAFSASRLYESLETQTDWKTCTFHFFGTFACFQKRRSFFKIGGSGRFYVKFQVQDQPVSQFRYLGMWFCPHFSKVCHVGKLFCCFYWMRCMCICLCSASY